MKKNFEKVFAFVIYITGDTILNTKRHHAELVSTSIKLLQEIFMKNTTQLSRGGCINF